jgi:hypothetical protein
VRHRGVIDDERVCPAGRDPDPVVELVEADERAEDDDE